jgi:hypothetical protein
MMPDLQIDNEQSFLRALREGINLFTGAGFSLLAKDEEGSSLPVGNALVGEIRKHFDRLDLPNSILLPSLCTIIKSTNADRLSEFLTHRFTVGSFEEIYSSVANINVKNIVTVNIDDLLENIFKNDHKRYLNNAEIRAFSYDKDHAINTFYLHGHVKTDKNYKFTNFEMAITPFNSNDEAHPIRRALRSYPTLIWGARIDDPYPLIALDTGDLGSNKEKWILLFEPDAVQIELFRAQRFNIISGDTKQLLEYFRDKLLPSSDLQPAKIKLNKKIRNSIPTPQQITLDPARPIEEFYRGAPPTWRDVANDITRVYRTSHFRKIVNALDAKRNVIITSSLACGKTTLIMQIAWDYSFDGYKVFFSYPPSLEEAQSLINEIDGENALVIVDDFADDIDAISLLMSQKNLQVLVADQKPYILMAKHQLRSI